jgi:hypothetical protein
MNRMREPLIFSCVPQQQEENSMQQANGFEGKRVVILGGSSGIALAE